MIYQLATQYGNALIGVLVFVFGSIIGSFLNVCIYRLPRGKSLTNPSTSYCPRCHESIAWHDNIPLVSYLALGRRCRHCGDLISPRYFAVELLTALCFVLVYWVVVVQRGAAETSGVFAVYLALTSLLLVSSFIDLELRIIPDELTLGAALAVPVLSVVFPALHNNPEYGRDLLLFFGEDHVRLGALCASLMGMAVGSCAIWGSGVLGKALFRKEAMGMGDIKFIAGIGGLLGWKLVVLVFFLAAVIGAVIGFIVMIRTRDHHIPYGPFLSAATFLVMLWGHSILLALLGGRLL